MPATVGPSRPSRVASEVGHDSGDLPQVPYQIPQLVRRHEPRERPAEGGDAVPRPPAASPGRSRSATPAGPGRRPRLAPARSRPRRSRRPSISLIVFASEAVRRASSFCVTPSRLGQGRQEDELVGRQAEPGELGVRPAVHRQVRGPEAHREVMTGGRDGLGARTPARPGSGDCTDRPRWLTSSGPPGT